MTQDDLRFLNSLVDIEIEAALKKRELIQQLLVPGVSSGFPIPDQHQSMFHVDISQLATMTGTAGVGVPEFAGMRETPVIFPMDGSPPAGTWEERVTNATDATGDTDA